MRKTFHAGAAIGRPPVTVSANHEMANGTEDKNSLFMQRIVLLQIVLCGRAMRALHFFTFTHATGDGSSLSHWTESILSPSGMPPRGMVIGMKKGIFVLFKGICGMI